MSDSREKCRIDGDDDGGFLNGFCPLEAIVNRTYSPSTNYSTSAQNAFSQSCVTLSSKVVVITSVIFAILESLIFGLILVSLYGMTRLLVGTAFIFLILIAGERYRIIWSVSWWRNSTQQDVEPYLAFEVTTTWIKNITSLLIFLIVPIWLISIYFMCIFASMHGGYILPANILFVLITGLDVIIFLPVCAFPTAIYAACVWKRAEKDKERVEYLREIGV